MVHLLSILSWPCPAPSPGPNSFDAIDELFPRLPILASSTPGSAPWHKHWGKGVLTHRARAGLPEEGLEVSSRHEFQQDKSGQGLQTHPNTAHDVLVVEFAAEQRAVTTFH